MMMNDAVENMRHYGFTDEAILNLYKEVKPERTEMLTELEALGATPASLVNTIVHMEDEAIQ